MDHKMSKNETYIQSNKEAWSKLAKDHYLHFMALIKNKNLHLNPIVEKELGDLKGKKILHLQCNTGADSIALALKGALVTGVDLVPENIHYAKELAKIANVNCQFIASDVLKLKSVLNDSFDIVLTTDGVLGWIPDLISWGDIVHHFLNDDGFLYVHDGHPFMMIFDENDLDDGKLSPKYPYFKKTPDLDPYIGGYASQAVKADNYYWGHQMEDLLNGLIYNNLYLTYFKEYDYCIPGMGGNQTNADGFSYYPKLKGALPLVYSLKARKLKV